MGSACGSSSMARGLSFSLGALSCFAFPLSFLLSSFYLGRAASWLDMDMANMTPRSAPVIGPWTKSQEPFATGASKILSDLAQQQSKEKLEAAAISN